MGASARRTGGGACGALVKACAGQACAGGRGLRLACPLCPCPTPLAPPSPHPSKAPPSFTRLSPPPAPHHRHPPCSNPPRSCLRLRPPRPSIRRARGVGRGGGRGHGDAAGGAERGGEDGEERREHDGERPARAGRGVEEAGEQQARHGDGGDAAARDEGHRRQRVRAVVGGVVVRRVERRGVGAAAGVGARAGGAEDEAGEDVGEEGPGRGEGGPPGHAVGGGRLDLRDEQGPLGEARDAVEDDVGEELGVGAVGEAGLELVLLGVEGRARGGAEEGEQAERLPGEGGDAHGGEGGVEGALEVCGQQGQEDEEAHGLQQGVYLFEQRADSAAVRGGRRLQAKQARAAGGEGQDDEDGREGSGPRPIDGSIHFQAQKYQRKYQENTEDQQN